jgi:methyl-accepting chemotaxis protein
MQGSSEQVATAMNEMSATVHEVARNAASAAEATREADAEAQGGRQVMQEMLGSIGTLGHEVERAGEVIGRLHRDAEGIGGILDVIRSVAEQTNLLALNAAIEAARAGDQNRGFAVVADEVRTLAQRTQQSTQEIQAMIERLQAGAKEAVAVTEAGQDQAKASAEHASRTGEALESIGRAVATINDMNTQIATASE